MQKNSTILLFVLSINLLVFSLGCTPNQNNGPSSNNPIDNLEFDENGVAETDWETAVAILNQGDVEVASQLHNLEVTLFLKDGRQIKTVEPGIDDIFQAVEECGNPCKEIALMTE